jgi:hypothetical protein
LQQVERAELVQQALDKERNLVRYPPKVIRWPSAQQPTNAEVQANWNRNSQCWDAMYDEDGDRNRRYISDEPMLAMLGDVQGQHLLDVAAMVTCAANWPGRARS